MKAGDGLDFVKAEMPWMVEAFFVYNCRERNGHQFNLRHPLDRKPNFSSVQTWKTVFLEESVNFGRFKNKEASQ